MARKFQIGVMGSAADLKYSKEVERAAYEVGRLIVEEDGILFFGAEKDSDSLSTAACRGAKEGDFASRICGQGFRMDQYQGLY